ncbi:MAG TPA: hypothetical protein VF613_05810 [Longimicrobium sp.]|jgi:hypothetical protein
MRHTVKQRLASPGGEPRKTFKHRLLAAVAAPLACAALAAPAAAQQCSPSYRELAAAMYAQVVEVGGSTGGLDYWNGQLQSGVTVRQMVSSEIRWQGHWDRFVTGKDSHTILTYLYRHLLAREPDGPEYGCGTPVLLLAGE